ncbi:MAG: HAD family hydrolase [Candidatus Micrarchaeia archaeon]|jgi:FMN phosphatase YigB (HAD superfamily)
MIKAILFDFSRTLYDPDTKSLEPGALEVLEALSKKYPVGLLSKKGDGNRDDLFETLGTRQFFKSVVIVDEKSVDSFAECIQGLGVQPSEVLAIGDQAKKDVALAKQAGCVTVWFCKGKFANILPESAVEQPDFTIRSLDEIPQLPVLQ